MIEIIGRTTQDNYNNFENETFTKQNYYKVLNMAWKLLLKHKIDSLPIDLFKIAKAENWQIIKFSQIPTELKINISASLGYAIDDKKGNIIIFYNDTMPVTVQRFTIAHEFSHILLRNYGLPYKIKEKEAEMGSARILMPMCVLYECKVSSAEEISKLCQTSLRASQIRFNRLINVLIPRNKWYISSLERQLYNQFKEFIKIYLASKNCSFT